MNEAKPGTTGKRAFGGIARLPAHLEKICEISRILPDEYGDAAVIQGAELCLDGGSCGLAKLEIRASLLVGCRFAFADLFGASFTDVVFEDCDFSNCVLRDAYFSRCEFISCRLTGADFSGAVVKNVHFTDCAASFASFDGLRADAISFTGCDLGGASMRMCELRRCTLQDCSLQNAVLFRTPLAGMDLTSCSLDGLSVSESLSELRGAKIGFLQAPVIAKMLGIEVEY